MNEHEQFACYLEDAANTEPVPIGFAVHDLPQKASSIVYRERCRLSWKYLTVQYQDIHGLPCCVFCDCELNVRLQDPEQLFGEHGLSKDHDGRRFVTIHDLKKWFMDRLIALLRNAAQQRDLTLVRFWPDITRAVATQVNCPQGIVLEPANDQQPSALILEKVVSAKDELERIKYWTWFVNQVKQLIREGELANHVMEDRVGEILKELKEEQVVERLLPTEQAASPKERIQAYIRQAPDISAPTQKKCSYVLWLNPPFVSTPRFVHFSWGGQDPMAFKIRDYLAQPPRIHYQPGGRPQTERWFEEYKECEMDRDEVWYSAEKRIPATRPEGLFVSVDDFDFWRKKLTHMTSSESRGSESDSVASFPVCSQRASDNDSAISVEHDHDRKKQPDVVSPFKSNSISLWAFAGKYGPGNNQLSNASRLLCFGIGGGGRPCFDGASLTPEGKAWLETKMAEDSEFLNRLGRTEPRVRDITMRVFTEEAALREYTSTYNFDWNQAYKPTAMTRKTWFIRLPAGPISGPRIGPVEPTPKVWGVGDSGRYVLWLKPPYVATPRYVHFNWGQGNPRAFKIRDYIAGRMLRHPGGNLQMAAGFTEYEECQDNRDKIWESVENPAEDRIEASRENELFVSVGDDNFAWWRDRLSQMTESRLRR